VRLNAASFADPLPDALWDALRAAGMLHRDAPVPRTHQADVNQADVNQAHLNHSEAGKS
jgi:D-threo-aldose 1-dehydrogenase